MPSIHSSSAPIRLRLETPIAASAADSLQQQLRQTGCVKEASIEAPYDDVDVWLTSDADPASIIDVLESSGRRLERCEREFRIGGMYCAACTVSIEHKLNALAEVDNSSVNLATGTANVKMIEGFPANRIDGAIRAAGYKPLGKQSAQSVLKAALHERRSLGINALIAVILALPIVGIEMGRHLIHDLNFWLMFTPNVYWQVGIVMCVLAGIIQFGPGLRFYRQGLPSLWRGNPNMDSLVMLGSTAAWGYSTLILFFPSILPPSSQLLYFESSSVIITLVLFGRYLEAIARGHTSQAIEKLLALKPQRALRIDADGEHEVKAEDIQRGDRLRVLPGERLPVDGKLLDENAYLDQSMITGESLPVFRCRGDTLISGSINRASSFVYRATDVGERSTLAQIIRMVQRAQHGKLPIQSLADRVTYRFVPTVIAISIATLVIWLSIAPPEIAWLLGIVGAISVLIISCPCAMGLATPTSVMVASGEGSKMGLLFQRGSALQMLSEINYAVFDKTGTLTQGNPKVKEFIVHAGDEREVFRLAASLERHSEHPLGAAIIHAAESLSLQLTQADNVVSLPGEGIMGQVDNHTVVIGGRRAMHNAGIDVQLLVQQANNAMQSGLTVVYIAVDGVLSAMVTIGDTLLSMAARTIVELEQRGIVPIILSGDDQRTVAAIAQQLGIADFKGTLTPDDKREEVERLQSDGSKVAFIGDGINDAPALATASVGVAIGRGTDVAIEAADVILVTNDLGSLINAIALSRQTMRNIRQNLIWAFGYNILCIPLAAGLYYSLFEWMLSPEAAAFVMALSSLFVMFNALRLKHFEPPFTTSSISKISALGEHPALLEEAAEYLNIGKGKVTLWASGNCFITPLNQPLNVEDINRLCCLHIAEQEGMDTAVLVDLLASTKVCQVPLTDEQHHLIQQFSSGYQEAKTSLEAAQIMAQALLVSDSMICEPFIGEDVNASLIDLAQKNGISPPMLNYYIELGMVSTVENPAHFSNWQRLNFIRQARLGDIDLETTRRVLKHLGEESDLLLKDREAVLLHIEAFDLRQDILGRAQNIVSELFHSTSLSPLSRSSTVIGTHS